MKIAHVSKKDNVVLVQDLKEHLQHVAALCQKYMEKAGCGAMGYLVGLLHDAGKAGTSFQNRMEAIKAGEADPGQKGGHAFAGAAILNRAMGDEENLCRMFAVQAMCEAIFSHHAALPDNISPEGRDGYLAGMQDTEGELEEISQYLWAEIISREELDSLLAKAVEEAGEILNKIKRQAAERKEARYFMGLFQKLLLSALIDADWLDSAISAENPQYHFDELLKEETDSAADKDKFVYFLENLENSLEKKNTADSPLNVWRRYISDNCREAGGREGGIYTLSCPTGAGKTLAGLRFALTHSVSRQKEKIFYIIPYMSIIEQNTKSIKEAISREKTDAMVEKSVLELHGNAEAGTGREEYAGVGETFSPGFFAQRMAEPIVLTTMVRFLNTFFARGTRNIRPAHQFQNAVIIFDEIQTLPIKQIALFNGLINFLACVCNCTCVLCTATQPLLDKTTKPVYPVKLTEPSMLTNLPAKAKEVFRRVQIKPVLKKGGYSLGELSDFVWEKAQENGTLLAIMNTKQSALKLYREVAERNDGDFSVYYLSTRLYAAHRKEIITEIRESLSAEKRLIVISTQLIEAGVDLDFSCVVRSLAGMDSIVQAAGRCNRDGRRETGVTYIVNPDEETESLLHLKDIGEGARHTSRVLQEFADCPEAFEGDLLSGKAMDRYFQYYFYDRKEEMRYPLPKWKDSPMYELLSENGSFVNSGKIHGGYKPRALNQAFRTAADHYNVIETSGEPVFVRRKRGSEIWEKVQKSGDYAELKKLLKEAQQFVINVPGHEWKEIGGGKGVVDWDEKMGMYVLNEMYYDDKTGFTGEVSQNMPYYGF